MAPAEESAYFPSLSSCLDGTPKLLSWRTIAIELSHDSLKPLPQTILRHLQDPAAIYAITQCVDATPKAKSGSKAEFETLTSAINVTPTSNGRYDINQIKEDALWLSNKIDIDEVAALRLTVLEWQSRQEERLLQENIVDVAQDQSLNGLNSPLHASLLLSPTSRTATTNSISDSDFNSPSQRRSRLLKAFATEKKYLLQSAEYLVTRAVSFASSSELGSSPDAADRPGIPEGLGLKVLESWKLTEGWSSDSKSWFTRMISYLLLKISSIGKGSGWLDQDDFAMDLELEWSNTNVLEIISLLKICLLVGNSSTTLAPHFLVLDWFRFMAQVGFLESMDIAFPEASAAHIPYMQSLAALNSLAFLQLHQAIDNFPEISSSTAPKNDAPAVFSYLQNVEAIEEITQILAGAIAASIEPASLSTFAWSIILQTIRDYAGSSTEVKELRQSQKAIESYGATPQSDNDSVDGESGRRRISPHRRPSFGSDTSQQTTLFEDIVEMLQRLEPNDDLVDMLAHRAVEPSFRLINDFARDFYSQAGVDPNQEISIAARGLLVDLVHMAKDFIGYSESVVESIFSILLGKDDGWNRFIQSRPHVGLFEKEARLLKGGSFLFEVVEEALRRFPYENVPFVKLCRGLIPYVYSSPKQLDFLIGVLTATPSFTGLLTEPDILYELGGEGDHVSLRLTSPVNIMQLAFPSLKEYHRRLQLPEASQLPEGTFGRALSDSKPIVALWNYSYSSLRFFGLVLQTTLELRAESQISTSHNLFELSTEIVAFLTTWIGSVIASARDGGNPQDIAKKILEDTSDGLSRNQDVIAVILDLLEGELYKQHLGNQESDSTGYLARGVQFLSVLAAVVPSRVWSFLARSGLLGLHGTESRLTAVVIAAELPSGNFSILMSSIRLFEVMIEDAVANAATKQSKSKPVQRFNPSDLELTGTGIPENMMRNIQLQFTRVLMDTFQSSNTWGFLRIEDRAEVNSRICSIFDRILSVCLGADDESNLNSKLTGSLAPSAGYILDTFLSQASSDPSLKPLMQTLLNGLQTPFDTTSIQLSRLWQAHTISALHLTANLLRLNKFLGRPTCQLCLQIFNVLPVLAKLYLIHPDYCLPVMGLLEAAVIDAGTSPQPPSMLAHLGQSTARLFLDSISTFGRPVERTELSVGLWKFFSTVVSQRQQWLAVYLLTGRTPKERVTSQSNGNANSHAKPMIRIALDKLAHLQDLQPIEASAMLEFVALAADYWQPVALDMRNNENCKDACLKFITELRPSNTVKHSQNQADIIQYQIAAHIVNTLALLVHHSNERRDTTTLRHILPRLNYLIEHGVSTPLYNASLHHSLNRNFTARFSNCTLANFKRTSFSQPSLGPHFYYDISLADKMLRHDAAWQGRSNRGFANEFARANLNLSLVETQVKLFHSWKSLALQLSEGLAGDSKFQSIMASIVRDCLQANLDNGLPERFSKRLATSRADLSFALLQRLVEVAPFGDDARSVLNSAWALLRGQSSEIATLLVGDDAVYYRTLLRILYLSLQPHASSEQSRVDRGHDNVEKERSGARAKQAKDIEPLVLEMLRSIVAHSFRSLIVHLHEDPSKVEPADFALLTAIMRTAFQVPGVANYSERLLTHFDDERTAQYASTLLSWSDQLTTGNDPIYGELSITFLLELSNLPILAESLVLTGTFAQVATTNLFNFFRKPGGVGPFDQPARMYSIWVRGFLPLAINLLSAIGPPIAAELSTTLNQFEAQLSRASHGLGVKLSPVAPGPHTGHITLTMAAEAHALALITTVLKRFRESGASLGIVPSDLVELPWDSAGVREDLETRLQRRNNLRNNIVPTDEHEEAWSRQQPLNAQGECENRLEEKVVGELTAALSLLGNTEF